MDDRGNRDRWDEIGVRGPCPIERRFDGHESHVVTRRAGYKFPRVGQFKYAWGTHGGGKKSNQKKKKKEKEEKKKEEREKRKRRKEGRGRGNEIDEEARRGEGDWVVSRPTSLTPIEGVSRRKWRRQTRCRWQRSCSRGLSRRVISFCQRAPRHVSRHGDWLFSSAFKWVN